VISVIGGYEQRQLTIMPLKLERDVEQWTKAQRCAVANSIENLI